jgi:regulator-associated protein of mTOR
VRIFRNYDTRDVELVTAFRALTDMTPSTLAEAGLIADWQQSRGHLLIGGNVRNIRVWDAGKDASVQVCSLTRS